MITRAGLADEIDGFDLQIKALNDAKSAGYKAYREQLEDAGMEPRRAAAEVAATKAAIVKRRKLRENPDDAREKDDLIDAILMEIMDRPSRAREASQSYAEAKGVDAGSSSGRIAEFDSADAGSNPAPVATTGEITDTQEQPVTANQSEQPETTGPYEYAGTSSDENPATIPHSAVTPPAADKTGAAPLPSSAAPVAPFDNPRCLNACHLAHSKDACHDCLIAWSARPKEEQVRLWAEANAARAA